MAKKGRRKSGGRPTNVLSAVTGAAVGVQVLEPFVPAVERFFAGDVKGAFEAIKQAPKGLMSGSNAREVLVPLAVGAGAKFISKATGFNPSVRVGRRRYFFLR